MAVQDLQRDLYLDKPIKSTYDIVYSACGTARKSEFLLSLKSLQLMALSSPGSQDALYRVHIITGVPLCSLHWSLTHHSIKDQKRECWSWLAWLSVQPCSAEIIAAADGGLKKEDLQGLESSSIFLFILHSPNPIAAPLFAPCSTQRLYLHEHVDFEGISDVSPRILHVSTNSLACHGD